VQSSASSARAKERTRTSTGVTPPAPQAGASAIPPPSRVVGGLNVNNSGRVQHQKRVSDENGSRGGEGSAFMAPHRRQSTTHPRRLANGVRRRPNPRTGFRWNFFPPCPPRSPWRVPDLAELCTERQALVPGSGIARAVSVSSEGWREPCGRSSCMLHLRRAGWIGVQNFQSLVRVSLQSGGLGSGCAR
jgi:hypothetical protein